MMRVRVDAGLVVGLDHAVQAPRRDVQHALAGKESFVEALIAYDGHFLDGAVGRI